MTHFGGIINWWLGDCMSEQGGGKTGQLGGFQVENLSP